jgi:hypothetical protein
MYNFLIIVCGDIIFLLSYYFLSPHLGGSRVFDRGGASRVEGWGPPHPKICPAHISSIENENFFWKSSAQLGLAHPNKMG